MGEYPLPWRRINSTESEPETRCQWNRYGQQVSRIEYGVVIVGVSDCE